MWNDLLLHFKLINAAGGVVKNNKGEILFIFRMGKWDLPKGKIEKGESIEKAAIREVEEECGIGKIKITGKLNPTYHVYELKGKEIIKKTYWFSMKTSDNSIPKAQLEENISEVCWIKKKDIKTLLKNTYPSIADVVDNFLKKT